MNEKIKAKFDIAQAAFRDLATEVSLPSNGQAGVVMRPDVRSAVISLGDAWRVVIAYEARLSMTAEQCELADLRAENAKLRATANKHPWDT